MIRIVISAMAVAALAAAPSSAQGPGDPCAVDHALLEDASHLPRSRQALATKKRLTVVALGSSSTAGAGVGGPEKAWPAALQMALAAAFPKAEVTVLNRGLERQTAVAMAARIAIEIAPVKPDLVVWEVGTFEAMRGGDPGALRETTQDGVTQLKALGADVVLMDPQFSRFAQAVADPAPHVEAIASVSRAEDLIVFRRFAIMRDWLDSGRLPFVTGDRARDREAALTAHRCWGRLLAEQIAAAIR